MIPVLGVPYINRPDLMTAMIESIDEPIGRLVIIDNSVDGWAEKAGWIKDRFPDSVVLWPRHNLGVGASWNLIVKATPRSPWWAIVNADIAFAPGDLKSLVRAMDTQAIAMLFSMAAFAFSADAIASVGLFDENFVPAYCLAPETPVLTDDLRWVPIGGLRVGDGLVGVDEYAGQRYGSRAYRPSVVTGISGRMAQSVRMRMSDGREMVCSMDHKWLAKSPARTMAWRWMKASRLGAGYHLAAPLDVWQDDRSYEAGWLTGIIDGEACLHLGRLRAIDIAQKEGLVLDRIRTTLDMLGVPFTWRVRSDNSVAVVEISNRRYVMQLLGRLRPVRLMPRGQLLWDGAHIRSPNHPVRLTIESIKPVGLTEVVSLETSTRTFIANGAVSHNCEDNDWVYRSQLAGIHIEPLPAGYTHFASATIKSDLGLWAQNGRTYPRNVAYYIQKWGGEMGREVFSTPFNAGGSPAAWTLDLRRLAELTWEQGGSNG